MGIQLAEAGLEVESFGCAFEHLAIIHSLDLRIEALYDLLSLLHYRQIALMHVVGLEKVFAVNSRFLELRDFLHVLGVFKLDLGDQVLEVSHLRRRLLCFQFGDQVFQFIYPLDKLLRVLRDLVHENGILLHLSLETTRLI